MWHNIADRKRQSIGNAKLINFILRVVYFENLALNPYNVTKNILQFYGRKYTSNVEDFLNNHTQKSQNGVESTFRNSKVVPFRWMKQMSYEEVPI